MRFVTSIASAMLLSGLFITAFIAQARPTANGSELYKANCAMCHRVDGKGFPAMKTPDFTSPKWQASLTDEKVAAIIKNGKKGTAMPDFAGKLKDDEIHALVGYLRSLGGKKK